MISGFKPGIRTAAAAGAVILAMTSHPAAAADTTSSLEVSASVGDNCTVSTTAVAFGPVDVTREADDTATGTLVVTCTLGKAWSASAGPGSGPSATVALRKMLSGADELTYTLYRDVARTLIWGDNTNGTSKITGTGTGVADTRTIYGTVPTPQTVPTGSYADTVTVTVSY